MPPTDVRSALQDVRLCLARLSRLAAPLRHQPLEAALDALSKPIATINLGTADDRMADAEPDAAPVMWPDDSSDSKPAPDGGAASTALIHAVHRLRSAMAGGETSGETSGAACGDGPTGECRALLLAAASDARHASSAAESRRAAAAAAASKRLAAETVLPRPPLPTAPERR